MADEKDRFGDTMKLMERAKEDIYFAQKDRDLIEKLKAEVAKVESDHPHAGRTRQPRPAARFASTPAELRSPAPLLGEHTGEVLTELGVSPEQLAALRATGAVA